MQQPFSVPPQPQPYPVGAPSVVGPFTPAPPARSSTNPPPMAIPQLGPGGPVPPPGPNPLGAPGLRPIPAPPPILTGPTDGGPPFVVPIRPFNSRISQLNPGVPFPSLSADEQAQVKKWIDKDVEYEKQLVGMKGKRRAELAELQAEALRSQDWLGPDASMGAPPRGGKMRIRFEGERVKERDRGKRGNNRKEVKMPKAELKKIALQPEILIPIRLEYEHEAYKLRDTFTWNLRETMVTPEIFASHLCEDLRLPYHPFQKEIVAQIKRHIEDAHLTEEYSAHLGDDLEDVREENRAWWEARSSGKRRKVESEVERDEAEMEVEGDVQIVEEEDKEVMALKEFKRREGLDEELRVVIKLDITLDTFQLVDKFEWDISDPRNSPEEFAEVFAADLGLSGEFRTAIAHSIREQVDVFIKSLCLLGHIHGQPIPDDDLRREFQPSLFEPFRNELASEFTPLLNQLSPDEVERNDKEREREVRRKRRQTKGRGVTLPDRDAVKTHRTLVPKPNKEPIHSYQDSRGDMVYPMPEMSMPIPIVMPILPPKPVFKDDEDANSSAAAAVKAGTAAGPGSGNRFKRLKQGESGTSTPAGDGGRATTPSLEGKVPLSPKKVKGPEFSKEKLAELGLHEHRIDGQWFCANCGVPEALSDGHRKGPTGNNTLCGTCGKFFHRYRKMRTVEYTIDFEWHQNKKAEAQAAVTAAAQAKAADRRKETENRHAAQQQQQQQQQQQAAQQSRPKPIIQQESSDEGDDSDSSSASTSAPSRAKKVERGNSPDLPYVDVGSPDSRMSSLSSVSPPPAALPPPPPSAAPVNPPAHVEPPQWTQAAAADLRSKHSDDRFEIIPRPRPPDQNVQEWRVRCLDCPGKLYNLGPGESLDNFSVHFKNRQHRSNVEARLKGTAP